MPKKYYIETYGCQMNVADSEVVASILGDAGYEPVKDIKKADLILVNTCSIRENAEQRVWGRLDLFRSEKRKRPQVIVGVLGCMAERLKEKLLDSDKMVDMVVGPDAYRDLPMLVSSAGEGHKAVNVLLSREETYADISPVRLESNGVSAFISIMRGCNNMCAYCVVPYTRGAERSRDPHTIVREAQEIFAKGYREITLLGQNVNSYSWTGTETDNNDFPSLIRRGGLRQPAEDGVVLSNSQTLSIDNQKQINFPRLLEMVATIDPRLRVRFSTSHPKDLSDDVLHTMAKHDNICKHIHLPVQSGSSSVLGRMNRKYTREWYLDRINAIKRIVPDCTLSTDIIAGFCGETDEEHRETLSLMHEVGFDFAYMFKYSERPDTKAARHMKDDVPETVKTRRLNDIIALQNQLSAKGKKADIGKTFKVLVEGKAKKPAGAMMGRTTGNKVVVFQAADTKPGDYVSITIINATSATLLGVRRD
ncbi:MAG: radical SAM protein [Bacteroidales bacterium]|jgi:tRNA-2-methylthio-N6-dimethylallyladenosine synthase|nr:radical SAM protein [Bacteroidales bacterium]